MRVQAVLELVDRGRRWYEGGEESVLRDGIAPVLWTERTRACDHDDSDVSLAPLTCLTRSVC